MTIQYTTSFTRVDGFAQEIIESGQALVPEDLGNDVVMKLNSLGYSADIANRIPERQPLVVIVLDRDNLEEDLT